MEEVDYCRDPAKVRLLPGVADGLRRLMDAGFANIVITNQSGIGRGRITPLEYESVHSRLLELIGPGVILATYFCPDAPGGESTHRKPAPGMLLDAARDRGVDLARSFFVGDKASDLACGRAAGVRPILVETGYGAGENAGLAEFVAKDFASAVEFILKTSDAS